MNPLNEVSKSISRQTFLIILNAALDSRSYRFARQAADLWLRNYPGDLLVSLLQGKAFTGEGASSQANEVFQHLCTLDVEFPEAYAGLYAAAGAGDAEKRAWAAGCLYALQGKTLAGAELPAWGQDLYAAFDLLRQEQLDAAEEKIHKVIGLNLDLPLAAAAHLRLTSARGEDMAAYQLANLYHTRWPEALHFLLWLADEQISFGDQTAAVNLLHRCVAADAGGQVPARIWGSDHRYRTLWPDSFEINLDLPVPADVAALLGWNTLPAGQALGSAAHHPVIDPVEHVPAAARPEEPQRIEPPAPAPRSETKSDSVRRRRAAAVATAATSGPGPEAGGRQIEEAFEKLAKKLHRPSISKADGRFPIYVIFSTRSGLANQYGAKTAGVIIDEMNSLADQVKKRSGWGSLVFFPDDPNISSSLGISQTVESIDPWKLKLSLADLDQALAKKGSMIGALLIVGGAEVVPFHNLPNPTDDLDKEVPSDNPYATLDSNYFVPEWPVGRLPGEAGPDAGLLLGQLREVIAYHSQTVTEEPWWKKLWVLFELFTRVQAALQTRKVSKTFPSLGYTAAIWKSSSLNVYQTIGDSKSMLISPPTATGAFKPERVTNANLGYFNLHGLSDSIEWYGQRDLSEPNSGPDYPVALSAKDLVKNGHAPNVVFTEACYGGHTIKKTEGQSMALKFLSIGTQAVVGCTCVAYGSVTAPLIGADLLGSLFWKYMRNGLTVGEAMMQAKIELVREMNKRQGFMDGEDQKTLISFVLYGDPLMATGEVAFASKTITRFREHPTVKTICDKQPDPQQPQRVSKEILMEVKQIVDPYLPGIDDADFMVSEEHDHCDGENHTCPTAQLGQKVTVKHQSGRMVVTVSKQVHAAQHVHHHYARVTLDPKGKLVKLAISR
ncbi:MAG: hypothetical protein GYA17_11190 [Chloroflexi bacterium]|nr:hypothetical protein [Anaerolineaceae bacterium]NMB88916.1 hypothetical protein [Chloroflexota bacterium]